jgi:tetratricopeptide (TPR) repeat protein
MIRPFILAFLFGSLSSLGQPLPVSTSYWKSEAFLKEFNGSYRINANIEPAPSSAERGLLVEMQSLMAKGERTKTISKLSTSSLLKESPLIQYNLANVYSEAGTLDKALIFYKKAIGNLPSFRRAHQNIAFTYYRNQEPLKAHEHLLEVVRLGGSGGSVHGLLGHCFLEKKQAEPALRSFRQALVTQPESAEWQSGLAQALQALNRPEEALLLYEALAQKSPDKPGLQLQLALTYYELGQTNKAIALLEFLRRSSGLESQYELLLGTLLIGDQNLLIGAQTLKRVINGEDFKGSEEALSAIQYCVGKNHDGLALELHGLIKKDDLSSPGLVRFRRLHAQILLQKTPNIPEGIAILKELITSDPTDSHSLHLLGQQQFIAQKPHDALLLLDQAIHAEGTHSHTARLAKVQVLVSLKRYGDTIKELDNYLKERPDEERVREYLETIKRLHSAVTLSAAE